MLSFLSRFMRRKGGPRRIHLDYASATPVHPLVYRAMRPYLEEHWANPGAVYAEGVRARQAVEDARMAVARTLRVRSEDIVFTGGGTESNNLAIIGSIEHLHTAGKALDDMEIITTKIEHPSVLEAIAALTARGLRVVYAPILESGRIDMEEFKTLLSPKTVLVTVAYVNSETGVVQDIKKLTRIVRSWNTEHAARVLVHVDASQAPLWFSCAMDMLGADLLTLDAGKCYGPKGAGVLVRRHRVPLRALTFGGGQEGGLRSGTENVPLIVGCAKAIERAQEAYEVRGLAMKSLRDRFFTLLAERLPQSVVNGSLDHRAPNNVNISLPGYDSEYAVIWLDAKGIAASTKSACGVGKGNGSDVVRAMTGSEQRALSTIRFTLGEETTWKDIVQTVEVLVAHCARVQESGSVAGQ